MYTVEELRQIRARIDYEYAKDIEAVDAAMNAAKRLSKFQALQGDGPHANAENANRPDDVRSLDNPDPNLSLLSSGSDSILGGLETIIREHSDRTWTSKQLKAELLARGYELLAKNPMATIGVSLKKLADRGRISVARYGSGREPHLYKWAAVKSDDCEYKPEESEAA